MWYSLDAARRRYLRRLAVQSTDIVEHPRLVADRLFQYSNLVGKEYVIAGTDCGVGPRVWNGEIAWAKFAAMAEGARIASRELWGSAKTSPE